MRAAIYLGESFVLTISWVQYSLVGTGRNEQTSALWPILTVVLARKLDRKAQYIMGVISK
jgi:hypothetical protein